MGAWQCPDSRVMEVNGYDFANDRAVHVISDYIEREFGFYAMQAPSLPTGGHQPPASMMLAAVLAGLGVIRLGILHPTQFVGQALAEFGFPGAGQTGGTGEH